MKHTFINKEVCNAGAGDYIEYEICANDDGSVLAVTCNEHLANVIQAAVDADIEKHESTAWQE